MNEKRLNWKDASPKTSFCYNKDMEYLGCLQYENVGRHMHWCWYQAMDIRMSPGCLQEVRDKQKELIKKKNGKN